MLKHYTTFFAGSIIWACFVATLAAAEKPVEGPIGAFLGKPRMEVQPLFKAIRHPNVVVTLKGTVLATLGAKSFSRVVVRMEARPGAKRSSSPSRPFREGA